MNPVWIVAGIWLIAMLAIAHWNNRRYKRGGLR